MDALNALIWNPESSIGFLVKGESIGSELGNFGRMNSILTLPLQRHDMTNRYLLLGVVKGITSFGTLTKKPSASGGEYESHRVTLAHFEFFQPWVAFEAQLRAKKPQADQRECWLPFCLGLQESSRAGALF